MATTTELIKELREQTGAGIMDCKRALTEANNDLTKAKELLRHWGAASAAKKSSRETKQGTITTYVHANGGVGRVGAMVEVNCETDFVARTEQFRSLAERIAQHIVANGPEYVSADDVPANLDEADRAAILRDRVLLNQRVRDSNRTVDDLLKDAVSTLGENIRIGRFARFTLGSE